MFSMSNHQSNTTKLNEKEGKLYVSTEMFTQIIHSKAFLNRQSMAVSVFYHRKFNSKVEICQANNGSGFVLETEAIHILKP